MRKFLYVVPFGLLLAGCLAEGSFPSQEGTDAGNRWASDLGGEPALDMDSDFGAAEGKGFGETCDPFQQDCQGKCVPNSSQGESTCLIASPDDLPEGSECSTITECEKGQHCASLPNDEVNRCRPICDILGDGVCPSGMACTAELSSVSGIGLCADIPAACNIYTQDCAQGACIVRVNPETEVLGTYCGEAGARRLGDTCGMGIGECEALGLCVRRAQQPTATCQEVCVVDADCGRNGEVCSGQAASSSVSFCQPE